MAMVRCHDDQRIAQINALHRGLECGVQRDGVLQGTARIAAMMGMVNPACLNHQDIALWVLGQHRNRLGRHLGERWLLIACRRPVGLKLHMRWLKQTEQLGRLFGVNRGKALAVPHISALRVGGGPASGQVLAIGALAFSVGIFRVGHCRWNEVLTPTAQHDLKPVTMRPFDHLPGNVGAASGLGRGGHIGVDLPIALRGVRVGGGGRCVRDRRGGDDAGGKAAILCHAEQGLDFKRSRSGTVILNRLRPHANHAIQRFDAGDNRGRGRRAVGHLRVMRVSFD